MTELFYVMCLDDNCVVFFTIGNATANPDMAELFTSEKADALIKEISADAPEISISKIPKIVIDELISKSPILFVDDINVSLNHWNGLFES